MLDKDVIIKLCDRYKNLHPLLFQRSCEYARSGGDLFDILDTVPLERPIAWNPRINRWAVVINLTQAKFCEEGFGEK